MNNSASRRFRPSMERLEGRDVPHALALTPLVEVSGPSPFLGSAIEANDPAFGYSTEVEPYVSVDPTNSNHLVGAWIQDFARGIVAAVSFDGGDTWQSVALPGTTVAAGGIYPHSSDPWVTFSPDGTVYISLMGHDFPSHTPNAILVTKSTDGGLTWGTPATITTNVQDFNDKESITADPYDSRYVYATWSLVTSSKLIPMFSRSTDGGQTWEPARQLFDPSGNNNIQCGQIVVLPDGTLVNVFTEESFLNAATGERHKDFHIFLIRSTDHGQTWQFVNDPVVVSDMRFLGDTRPEFRTAPNPDGGTPILAPFYFFDLAVDPLSWYLYTVWPDARFGNGEYTGIAFSMSTDGGMTWSNPIQVNQTPNTIPAGNRQAFLPSVAVNDEGVVAVTYYDFRNNTLATGLPTDVWMVHAHPSDGLTNPASWSRENRITPSSFDMVAAPNIGEGYFLGDYQGLVAQGSHFGAFFSMPSSNDGSGVFYRDPLAVETTAGSIQYDYHPAVGGAAIGRATSHTALLDANVGWGWLVDQTPSVDSEFLTLGNQGKQNRMDLLTVLEYEVGHLLGNEHQTIGDMIDTLPAGTRPTPDETLSETGIVTWLGGVGTNHDEWSPWYLGETGFKLN